VPSILDNVAAVRSEIAAACQRAQRPPASVQMIAVTKSQGPEVLPELVAAGIRDFGENRIDHLEMMKQAAPDGCRFHAIGRVQGRQLERIAASSHVLHSLCEPSHIAKLSRHCVALGKTLEVFLEVNTSGEASKAGVAPADLPALVVQTRAAPGPQLVGLMTMAPELADGHADAATVRRAFLSLATLAKQHGLTRLSMGMSQDFPIAIEEGATDVRIGTRLFL
jgi:pyridoxal phosphate enzyme (YggS family)